MKEQPKWGPGEVTYGGLTRSMRREATLRQQLLELAYEWCDEAMRCGLLHQAEILRYCADELRRVLDE